MDWQSTRIRVFLFVQDRFGPQLRALAHRHSNNQPAFTDEEVLTIYLFGLIRGAATAAFLACAARVIYFSKLL